MGPTVYSPSEGKRAEDIFRPKNPTASAGCEFANLGTKGQHATSRPPKQLSIRTYSGFFMHGWCLCYTKKYKD